MRNCWFYFVSVLLLVLQFSCNYSKPTSEQKATIQVDSENLKQEEDQHLQAVNSFAGLPECSVETEGYVIFVRDLETLYACLTQQWSVVDLRGEKGDPGQQGKQGEAGVDGKDGKDGKDGVKGVRGSPGTGAGEDLDEVWRSIWKANVESVGIVVATYGFGSVYTGTAFVVGDGIMATNGHVVSDFKDSQILTKLVVHFPTDTKGDTFWEESQGVSVMAIDRSMSASDDLALLTVATDARRPLVLSDRDEAHDRIDVNTGVALNERAMLIGYSLSTTFAQFVTGHINAIQSVGDSLLNGFIDDGKLVYMYDLVSGGGSSGSPIFDLSGHVIGINFAGYSGAADVDFGFSLQVKHLRTLLATDRRLFPAIIPDHPDSYGAAASISLDGDGPQEIAGQIEVGDEDWFKINLAAGSYTIKQSQRDDASFDAYLSIYDSNVSLLSQDDDSGGGLDAQITLVIADASEVFIKATGIQSIGSYLLTIEENNF